MVDNFQEAEATQCGQNCTGVHLILHCVGCCRPAGNLPLCRL